MNPQIKSVTTKFNEIEFKINELANKLKNIKDVEQHDITRQLKRSLFKSMEYRYKDKSIHNAKAMNAAITMLSKSLGLDLITDEELNPNTLTICGSTFVIDILNTESEISVSITASNEIQIPSNMNEYLTNLIKSPDMFAFEEATKLIGFVDKFASDPKMDLFQCLNRLEEDLKFIYGTEFAFMESCQPVIRSGHGYPTFYQQSIGPCITYFADTQVLFDFENHGKELDETNSYLARISLVSSTDLVPCLPQTMRRSCCNSEDPIVLTVEEQSQTSIQELMVLGSTIQTWVPNTNSQSILASFAMKLVPEVKVTKEIEHRIRYGGVFKDFEDYSNYEGSTFEHEFVDRFHVA
jgi:hypothetical protein